MTAETLLRDGGFLSDKDHKYYELLVAEVTVDGKPKMVGYAMWFYAWTSWEGECPFKCCSQESFQQNSLKTAFYFISQKRKNWLL